MSDLGLTGKQVGFVNKAFWRNPANAFFTFAFPLMFLVIFTSLFGGDSRCPPGVVECPQALEVSVATIYVPAILVFSIITATYTNLAINVSFNRDQGVLKRIKGSPIPGWTYLSAKILHAIVITIILVGIVVAFGWFFYDAEVPTRTLPAFAVTIIVGALTFSALGLAITALIPNADAAPAVVNASILPLLFLSGVFIPISDPNAWYVTVSKFFPVYHFAEATNAAYFAPSGNGFQADNLLILGIWGLAGVILALLFFSWEPRR